LQVLCPFDSSLWTVTKNFALLQILELEARSGKASTGAKSTSAAGKMCEICCTDDGEADTHEATVHCMDCEQNMCDKVRPAGPTSTPV
jgi:hypothetical protein